MHAIGDITYVAFVGIHVIYFLVLVVSEDLVLTIGFGGEVTGPNTLEHALRDLTMQPADAVHFLTSLAKEGGHAEALALVFGVLTTESHEIVPANAEFAGILTEIFSAKAFVEVVVAGGNGSVDGIERAGAHQFERFVEVETAFHEVGKALQVSQRGMSFVAVVNVLRDAEFFSGREYHRYRAGILASCGFPSRRRRGSGVMLRSYSEFISLSVSSK